MQKPRLPSGLRRPFVPPLPGGLHSLAKGPLPAQEAGEKDQEEPKAAERAATKHPHQWGDGRGSSYGS